MSFYDLEARKMDGSVLHFSELKGKFVLVVNTASFCGYTRQFEGLQELSETLKDKLIILGFPCNDFGGQEPGSLEEIKDFCEVNYKVTFQLMDKINVVGKNQHSVYTYLMHYKLNGVNDFNVKWNFHKFLMDTNGKIVASLDAIMPYEELIYNLILPIIKN